jgi:hypothetical protein
VDALFYASASDERGMPAKVGQGLASKPARRVSSGTSGPSDLPNRSRGGRGWRTTPDF